MTARAPAAAAKDGRFYLDPKREFGDQGKRLFMLIFLGHNAAGELCPIATALFHPKIFTPEF
jgi:hypothetical protein